MKSAIACIVLCAAVSIAAFSSSLTAFGQTPTSPQPPATQQPPAAQQPATPTAPVLALQGDAAVITLLIKPDKTAEFEQVLTSLKTALNKSSKSERKQQAAGWKVFKTTEMVQGNAVYVMRIEPVVKDAEYDITRLLAEEMPSEVQDLFAKYKDAFAGRAVTQMNLFMAMSDSPTSSR